MSDQREFDYIKVSCLQIRSRSTRNRRHRDGGQHGHSRNPISGPEDISRPATLLNPASSLPQKDREGVRLPVRGRSASRGHFGGHLLENGLGRRKNVEESRRNEGAEGTLLRRLLQGIDGSHFLGRHCRIGHQVPGTAINQITPIIFEFFTNFFFIALVSKLIRLI